MTADRYNEGKPRMDLVPMYAIEELAKVYAYGCEKYDDNNWRKGLEWNKGCAASLMRHLSKWQDGEDYDEESGLPHDVHIAWNALTLVAMRVKDEGTDDRYKSKPVKRTYMDVPLETLDNFSGETRVEQWRNYMVSLGFTIFDTDN